MTNEQIEERFSYLVKSERRITREILELLCLVEARKFYLEQAYPTLFDWLVRKHGYSQSAAFRRIQAARLLKELPAIREKLVSGELNLSTLAQVQSILKKEEKVTGEKITFAVKSDIVSKIEGKSFDETNKILRTQFPVAVIKTESLRSAGMEHTKLMVVLEDADAEALRRAKQLLSHSCQSWSQVVAWLVRDYLKRKDPMLKK